MTNPRGWHYLYPPLFALLVAPLSIFDTESQVLFWYALNVAFTFGCFAESRRLWLSIAGPQKPEFRRIAICAALAVVLPFLDCMQAGQLGIAILYFLMLGSRLVLQSQRRAIWFLGGLTLALPASVKLVPALPVVFLLAQQWLSVLFPLRGDRPWARAITSSAGVSAGAVLYLLLIPASIIGWQKNLHSLDVWQKQIVMNERVGPDANFNVHSYRNQSLTNGVYLLSRTTRGISANVSNPVRVLNGVLLILLLAVAATVGRRGNGLDAFSAFGLAPCAMLLVSPIAWGHYFMAELPALLCVPTWLSRRGMPRAARIAAILPALLSWSYYLAMPQVGGLGLLGLGTAAWFLGVCGLLVWPEVLGVRESDGLGSVQERGVAAVSRPHSVISSHPIFRARGGRRRQELPASRGR